MGAVLWRAITLKLNGEVLLLRHDLEKKDIQISNLQDVQVLSQRGLEERFEHVTIRLKNESASLEKRLRQVEHFLAKTTEFEPRD